MTLSDYERRVLRELEYELTADQPGWWMRAGIALRRWAPSMVVSGVLVAVTVVVAVTAPSTAAIVTVAVCGFGCGLLWGARLRSQRGSQRRWWVFW